MAKRQCIAELCIADFVEIKTELKSVVSKNAFAMFLGWAKVQNFKTAAK